MGHATPRATRDEVCSAGVCGLSCVGGTTDCGGLCVDTDNDPAHCGGCDNACGDGEGVLGGTCETTCGVNNLSRLASAWPVPRTYNTAGGDNPLGPDTVCDADVCEVLFGAACDQLQTAYLKASNADADNQFGYSVAVSGDTLVVGAPARAVPGPPTSLSATPPPTPGPSRPTSRPPNAGSNSTFSHWRRIGVSVAVSGDTLVAGAHYEGGDATTAVAPNDNATNAGAAYVFVRDTSTNTWSQQATKASNTDVGDSFGRSVAVSGGTIVVGGVLRGQQRCRRQWQRGRQQRRQCRGRLRLCP